MSESIQRELIEIPVALYCELKGIPLRTAYNKIGREELKTIVKNDKKYVLVHKDDIFILEDYEKLKENLNALEDGAKLNKNLNSIQKRRNKQIVENLRQIQARLSKVIGVLDKGN